MFYVLAPFYHSTSHTTRPAARTIDPTQQEADAIDEIV